MIPRMAQTRFMYNPEQDYPYNDTYRWNQILDSVMPDLIRLQKSTYGHELK